MTISKQDTTKLLILPKKLKAILEQISAKENRSLNNLIVTVLLNYVQETHKEEKTEQES